MKAEVDVVVVGGGVVGLATAAALAGARRSVVLIERNAALAGETSARNSGVIHAGIYYPTGSLKAEFCVSGRRALAERCARLRIPHRRLGKLIVASDASELAIIEGLALQAHANGVSDVALIDAAAVRRHEPAVNALAALSSPASGIIDATRLALSYAAEAEEHAASLVLRTEVVEIERTGDGYRVATCGADGTRGGVVARAVVNSAGLASDALAERAGFDVGARGHRLQWWKGDYCSLVPAAPIRLARLVYPVPAGGGLGIHATLDLAGRLRFGPDAEAVSTLHCGVAAAKAVDFAAAIRRHLPALRTEWLQPDFAGIRPRLAGPGVAFRDFVLAEESAAGMPGFVNLIGIDSPGLTAAPTIAARVVSLLASL